MDINCSVNIMKTYGTNMKTIIEWFKKPIIEKQPWIGLSSFDWACMSYTADFKAGAKWAEDRLKEKNT